jgi:hypothetical protein
MSTLEYTVNSGVTTASEMGRLESMNGHSYPNRPINVLTGQGGTTELPRRCSQMDFTQDSVYIWM